MSSRKFYGSHFHSLVVHAPETYRLFCLRSLLPEQEERSFGDLRSISESTSNRQAKYVVDNAVLYYNAQQSQRDTNSLAKQESVICIQSRLLHQRSDSAFSKYFIRSHPDLMQGHCKRIADFLLPGKGIWWSELPESILFHDGPPEIQKMS